MAAPSFDAIFKRIDDEFEGFESLVESAKYEEANAVLPSLATVIRQLGKSIQELPDICVTITTLLPEKISSLENHYKDLRASGYPLFHIMNGDTIVEMSKELDDISERVKAFNLRNVVQELDAMQARIEDFLEAFDKEKEARTIFEKECDKIYADDAAIEKKYIHLCNALPGVKKVFIIPPEEQAKIDGIKNLINIAGATKRSLDTLIHSGTKQPFTLLVEKMRSLGDEAGQASSAIDEFDRYLFSLKADAEAAMAAVEEYNSKLHKAEVRLRLLGVDSCTNKFQPSIDELYQVVSDLYDCIRALPIDILAANEMADRLKTEGEKLCQEVDRDYEQALFADQAILFANRDRQNLSEVDDTIRQNESLFFDGEFKKAYDETMACVKRLRGE